MNDHADIRNDLADAVILLEAAHKHMVERHLSLTARLLDHTVLRPLKHFITKQHFELS